MLDSYNGIFALPGAGFGWLPVAVAFPGLSSRRFLSGCQRGWSFPDLSACAALCLFAYGVGLSLR
ncbi:hypothetical protein P0D75_36130, partial [Paraburkholderia sediminicola]|uniref:hypothetical protein n=1 Tax=Paraburkholderia sediminicola TaxID=458836 RepID=UPI0038BE13EE